MSDGVLLTCNAVAVLIIVFAMYFPRYHRKDMVLAIVVINVGVVAVAMVLSRADVTAGLGLGLFGVLSIIRLRSREIDQEEVAYYFSAIALGLLAGVRIAPDWVAPALMAAIVVVLFLFDHPRLFASCRSQTVTLDRAITDEAELKARLERLFGAQILGINVKRVDLVDDTTVVDVRYRLRPTSAVS